MTYVTRWTPVSQCESRSSWGGGEDRFSLLLTFTDISSLSLNSNKQTGNAEWLDLQVGPARGLFTPSCTNTQWQTFSEFAQGCGLYKSVINFSLECIRKQRLKWMKQQKRLDVLSTVLVVSWFVAAPSTMTFSQTLKISDLRNVLVNN